MRFGRRRVRLLACCFVSGLAATATGGSTGWGADAGPRSFSARDVDSGLARIITPRQAGVDSSGPVKIIVRLRGGVTSFRAELGKRDITKQFTSRSGGGRRVASLSGIRPGEHRLRIRTTDRRGKFDWDLLRFVVARPSEDFLSLREHPTGGRQHRLQLSLTKKSATVRAWLNGRPLHRSLDRSGRVRSATLDADHGLRHGRNQLRVLAFHKNGVADVDHRTIVLRGTRPIAGAGPRRRVREGDSIRLDARASRAMRPQGDLSFRWKIVKAPKGSKASLRDPRSATPTLRLDKRGSYKLRLHVAEPRTSARPSGWSAGLRARAAGASRDGPVADNASPGAADGVTATAVAPVPPVGTPIQADPAVGVSLPELERFFKQEDALQLVALDRTDKVTPLELLHNEAYPDSPDGTAELVNDIQALDNRALVILTGTTIQSNIDRAVAAIGGGESIQADGQSVSVIGIRDAPGSARYNVGLQPLTPPPDLFRGSLDGYLQLDNQDRFAYVPHEYVPFNTAAEGPPTSQAVITVGEATYRSDTSAEKGVSAGQAGYYVLVLDAGTLALREQGTFATDVGDFYKDADGLEGMNTLLEKYDSDRAALVFIQSIGNPKRRDGWPAYNWYNGVAAKTGFLGGSNWLFLPNPPDDTPGYAQVGLGDKPAGLGCCPWEDTKVASAAASGTAGQVKGMLGRNARGQFHPVSAGAALGADNSFQQVAYQPTVDWPFRDDEHQPAIECIAGRLDKIAGGLSVPIERNYLDEALQGNWSDWGSDVRTYKYGDNGPGPCDWSKFSETAFNELKEQLADEFEIVPQVYALIDKAQSYLGASQQEAQAVITEAAHQVTQDVSSGAQTGGDASDIIEGILDIGWAIPGPQQEVVGPIFGITEGVYSIAEGFMNTSAGSPALNVQAAGDKLGDEVAAQYGELYTQIDRVGGLLLSDWGKLQTTAKNVKPGGPWAFNVSTATDPGDAIALSARAWTYQQLVPLVYAAFEPQEGFSPTDTNPGCRFRNVETGFVSYTYPFEDTPGAFSIVTGAGDTNPQTVVWLLGRRDTTFLKYPTAGFDPPSGVPSQGLIDKMFRTNDQNIGRPPLPSELRFLVDGYAAEGAHDLSTGELGGGCAVDGRAPGYQIPPPD